MKGIQKRKRKLNVLAIMACLILGLGTVFVTPYNGMSKVYADEGDDVAGCFCINLCSIGKVMRCKENL